jgi:DNA modification methylase
MPQQSVADLLPEIGNYQIPVIPGIFIDDQPSDDAAEKVKKEWEEKRQAKIVEENTSNADHSADFAVPIYNVWKQQNKSEASEHFGNSEVAWVDRLLYLYTQPFDIVIDPFAGGGSTLDICKKRFRRCWLSDRIPIEERQKEIRTLDLTEGLPDLAKNWSKVRLVYLDPPYWKQAECKYSEDPTDLANMPLDKFTKTLAGIINDFAKKLTNKNGAYIALIIQPTQWKAPERQFTDHIGDMLRAIELPVDMRFSVPYESQQCTAQMVDWAKENKRCLVLTREIVVWRVA